MTFEQFLESYDAARLFGVYVETETHFHGATFVRKYDRLRADYATYAQAIPAERRRPMAGPAPADDQAGLDLTVLYEGVRDQRWQDKEYAILMSVVAYHLVEPGILNHHLTPDDVRGAKLSLSMDNDVISARVTLARRPSNGVRDTAVRWTPDLADPAPDRLARLLAERQHSGGQQQAGDASVIDSYLGALAAKRVWWATDPPKRVRRFSMPPTYAYEIAGRIDSATMQQHLETYGTPPPARFNAAEAWRLCGDMLPNGLTLLGFRGTDSVERDYTILLLAIRDGDKVEFSVGIPSDTDSWMLSPLSLTIENGLTSIVWVSADFYDDRQAQVKMTEHEFGVAMLMHMLDLIKHQAIEYRMAASGPGLRRHNAKLDRGQPPLPRPRIWDLSKPKVELIPVVEPKLPSAPTGITQRPHDKRGHWRTLSHRKYGNRVGTQVWVRACKVHGGAKEPKKTIIILPEDKT